MKEETAADLNKTQYIVLREFTRTFSSLFRKQEESETQKITRLKASRIIGTYQFNR